MQEPGPQSGAHDPVVCGIDPTTSRRPFYAKKTFLCTVVAPTLLSGCYFGLLASNSYVSESRFVVHGSAVRQQNALSSILGSTGYAEGTEEANAVVEYIGSRNALADSDADGYLTRAYGNTDISWFDRFRTILRGFERERFYEYYKNKVIIQTDSATSVTTLTVHAFSPNDAREINHRLLLKSEALVDRLAERARTDAVLDETKAVNEAQDRVRMTALALSDYRNRNGVLDPEKEAELRMQVIAKLQDDLITARNQLQQLQAFTPNASQIPFQKTRVTALEQEIARQSGSIAGGKASLSAQAAEYQKLKLESDLAEQQLSSALDALKDARVEARRKHAYVERIAAPSLPDYPNEPLRVRNILATLVLSLLAWGVLSTVISGIREHGD